MEHRLRLQLGVTLTVTGLMVSTTRMVSAMDGETMNEGKSTGSQLGRAPAWIRKSGLAAVVALAMAGASQYAASGSGLASVSLADTNHSLQVKGSSGLLLQPKSLDLGGSHIGLHVTPAQPAMLATAMKVEPAEPGLSAEMMRVRDWVSKRYRVSSVVLEPVLMQAEDSARQAGLDPLLIVAMMAVESGFNPYAESHMGAQGLMQVIPRYHMDKIGEHAGEHALFDPVLNVHVGTLVLAEGVQRFGSLQAGLQYYGGARNDPNATYAKKVFAMKRKIASAAGIEGA